MERDEGNLYVLEATMLSLILLGAAYAVQGLQDSSVQQERPRAELSRLVDDALIVLAGLDEGNGTLLDLYLAEAIHCAYDAVPSALDCDDRRSQNLSIKLESYLPLGAGYAVGLGNGAEVREIYRSPAPMAEAVSTSVTFSPAWHMAFVYTEMDCYPVGVDINATMLPISRAARTWVEYANLTHEMGEVGGERAYEANAWNLTLSAGSRKDEDTLIANVTGNGTFQGATSYEACSHAGDMTALRTALAATTFTADAASVALTTPIGFEADLSALAAVPGVTLGESNITIFEPIPGQPRAPDTWIRAATVSMGTGTAREAEWTPAPATLYGAHPALLRIGLDIAGVHVELRKAIVLDVGLPTGEVPIDPPYRATLQAWLPDWG